MDEQDLHNRIVDEVVKRYERLIDERDLYKDTLQKISSRDSIGASTGPNLQWLTDWRNSTKEIARKALQVYKTKKKG